MAHHEINTDDAIALRFEENREMSDDEKIQYYARCAEERLAVMEEQERSHLATLGLYYATKHGDDRVRVTDLNINGFTVVFPASNDHDGFSYTVSNDDHCRELAAAQFRAL